MSEALESQRSLAQVRVVELQADCEDAAGITRASQRAVSKGCSILDEVACLYDGSPLSEDCISASQQRQIARLRVAWPDRSTASVGLRTKRLPFIKVALAGHTVL